MPQIDLNADLGESLAASGEALDEALLASITSANIACGLHAGSPEVMRRTVRVAQARGVSVGAHPGLADHIGFGRREIPTTASEAADLMLYQLGALAAIAQAEGVRLRHVKPHGALYNMAVRDATLAAAIAAAVASFDRSLVLVGLADSPLTDAGRAAGLQVAAEAFVDRAYTADGTLASRRLPGSVIEDPTLVVARAVRLATEHRVETIDGGEHHVIANTLCLHGDTPGAPDLARLIRAALAHAGVTVVPLAATTR